MKELKDYQLYARYDEFLDEIYPDLAIAGLKGYLTSRVLKQVDTIAYNTGYGDWLDSELQAGYITEKGGKYYESND